jgi:hypothetical protein
VKQREKKKKGDGARRAERDCIVVVGARSRRRRT